MTKAEARLDPRARAPIQGATRVAGASPVLSAQSRARRRMPRGGWVVLTGLLMAAAVVCAGWTLWRALPPALWVQGAVAPDPADPAQLVFHFATLPRLATAVLAGAALAGAGTIFQHVLQNPLASPVTLGISSGAQLALVAATIFVPAALGPWSDLVALAGGLGAMTLVLGIAAAQRFSSLALILAGLAVGLFCGSLGHVLKLVNQEYMAAIFLWGAGALDQTDWSVPKTLLPRLGILALLTALLVRPLRLLSLGQESARGLGVSLTLFRFATLAVAVALAAVTVATVGMIAFVEIAAPLIARLIGARRLGMRLVLAPVIGAALLVIVDTAVQVLNERLSASLPTGAATAFLGAPLLLGLLPRMRGAALATAGDWSSGTGPRRSRGRAAVRARLGQLFGLGWRHALRDARAPVATAPLPTGTKLGLLAILALVGLVAACLLGRTGAGWTLLEPANAAALLPWRLPRSVVAFTAGALLASAGTLLQRATGNPLAGPEILGLGAAVVAGLAVALLLRPEASAPFLLAMGTGGAMVLLAILFWSGLRSRFAPDQLLLTGIALTAALDAVVIAFLVVDDSRAGVLLGWMSGSAAGADTGSAAALLGLAAVLVPLGLLLVRALDILPLGDGLAAALGVALGPTRLAIMTLASLMTAAAVLATGPLSFVGLVGPHLARRLGFQRSAAHLGGAALLGGFLMALADLIGRLVTAPFEIPAGLVAALIGCPYLVIQLRRHG